MGKIIYIMGKSSSGKDTIYHRLLGENDWNLKTIVPYTTRPIRIGEKPGVSYHFTDEQGFMELKEAGKVIEDRAYNTVHGIWRYFTVDEEIDLKHDNYVIIGTIESYERTKEYFGEEFLLPIYVDLDDGVRLQRALDREKSQEAPKYNEMCRRFLADSEDFSEEKILSAGIDRRFENDDLERCLKEIKEYIAGNIF